jgi:LysR family hydrogen peroxide-inducible transcriptional activator
MITFRDHPFTLRQLQYLVAVARTGGFGAAALACGVSQPSLSAQVAKIEEVLGVAMFERNPRGVRLTSEGRELLPIFERMLATADELVEQVQALVDPELATLRIGVIPTVAPYLLPAAVRALREQFPKLTIHWIEAQTADVEAALAKAELDAGIIADPPTDPAFTSREIGADRFFLLVPSTRKPTRRQRAKPADLAGEEVLLLADGHCLREHALDICVRAGAIESPFRATSLSTLVQMVGAGLGVTLLPSSAVEVEVSRAPVRAVPFAEPAPRRTLRLVWAQRSRRGALLERVAATIAEVFDQAGRLG